MASIEPVEIAQDALLARYAGPDGYADCYAIRVPCAIGFAEYVEAFYTTLPFRAERLLLAWLVARPSSAAQAKELAAGTRQEFAAWKVEARADKQLLMCDFQGRTRSWLGVEPDAGGGTRLLFGSAVVAVRDRRSGERGLGTLYSALLGFHRLYSRVLLGAAARRLRVGRG